MAVSVPFLKWSDDYLLGIEEIDFEHREFFVHLNVLHDELINEDDKNKIEDCLVELHLRLKTHFDLENKYIRDHQIGDFNSHVQEHKTILNNLTEFINEFTITPGLNYGDKLKSVLGDWILDHIQTRDREIAEYIKVNQIKPESFYLTT
jgi:hemerythrin